MTWKDFIRCLPYYIKGSKQAECIRFRHRHSSYRFSPEQLFYMSAPMYLLYCEECEATMMFRPVSDE